MIEIVDVKEEIRNERPTASLAGSTRSETYKAVSH